MALASDVYPPEVWALESLMVLRDNLVMAGLVHRNFENEVSQRGDTVHTRKPMLLTVNEVTAQSGTEANLEIIEPENPSARDVTVILDKHKYTGFLVSDIDEATSIKDLRAEFIEPAIIPISAIVDDDIITEYTGGTDVVGSSVSSIAEGTVGLSAGMDEGELINADRQLNVNQCPTSGRVCVLGTQHNADLLARPLFHQASTAGEVTALRRALITEAFGFTVYKSQNIPNASDSDDSPQSLAFHRNVMALVTRPLGDIPAGLGAQASRQQIDDISIRVVSSYAHRGMGVMITFDILYGVNLLDANLGVIINP